jgi:hypothetical protein
VDALPVIGWALCSFVGLALLGLWLGWLATRGDDHLSHREAGGEPATANPPPAGED